MTSARSISSNLALARRQGVRDAGSQRSRRGGRRRRRGRERKGEKRAHGQGVTPTPHPPPLVAAAASPCYMPRLWIVTQKKIRSRVSRFDCFDRNSNLISEIPA